MQQKVSEKALSFVKKLGWNDYALIRALEEHDLSPGGVRALFPDGAFGLAEQLMVDWENKMTMDVSKEDLQGLSTSRQLFKVLQKRLSYEEEFMPGWREAMLLGVDFKYLSSVSNRLFSTMNSVWDIIGDQSTGIEWYTKRTGLMKVFVVTECMMIHDASPQFRATYDFLEEQIEDKEFASINDFLGLYWVYAKHLIR